METTSQSSAPNLHAMAKYRTCKTAFDFSADLEQAAKVLGVDSARDAAVTLGLTLVTKISQRTPVKTGRARANWFIAEGAPRLETTESTAPQTYTGVGLTGASVIFITNSLPYIVPLEYGHSQQAPSGMVRISIAEVLAVLKLGGAAA